MAFTIAFPVLTYVEAAKPNRITSTIAIPSSAPSDNFRHDANIFYTNR